MRRLILIPIALALASCNVLKSKEEECLQSSRLEFKDPESLQVIQNLGRLSVIGEPTEPTGFFWLRYKAKNSYGAYESADMACKEVNGRWVRLKTLEELRASIGRMDGLKAEIEKDISRMKEIDNQINQLKSGKQGNQ